MRDNWNSRDNDANCEGFPGQFETGKEVGFYTLGCKVNQYDTQAIIEQFRARVTAWWILIKGRYLCNKHMHRDQSCRQKIQTDDTKGSSGQSGCCYCCSGCLPKSCIRSS